MTTNEQPDYYTVKQVIVMRKDLNMRKGKMVAQGAHASIAWLTGRIRGGISVTMVDLEPAALEWITGRFTKICVGVDSEDELRAVYQRAYDAGLVVKLIEDAGFTEFGGVPTVTCCAVGPDWNDKVDAVTGDLKLL